MSALQHPQPDRQGDILEALWRLRVTVEIAERYVELGDEIGLARTLQHIKVYSHAARSGFDAWSIEAARLKHGRPAV